MKKIPKKYINAFRMQIRRFNYDLDYNRRLMKRINAATNYLIMYFPGKGEDSLSDEIFDKLIRLRSNLLFPTVGDRASYIGHKYWNSKWNNFNRLEFLMFEIFELLTTCNDENSLKMYFRKLGKH